MSVWRGRRVFLTGHTGFKGSWLALWLADMGAHVTGYALAPATQPSLFEAARLSDMITHQIGDVRDLAALEAAMRAAQPEFVFHLAAQPLVRYSYEAPVETYATNVMGTVHLLDAMRRIDGIKGALCVTSDKCYENREWVWPYRETDPMGGRDPYSNSKGCAELVVAAYRQSYFDGSNGATAGPAIASARAGNVIGGGDWAADRLIPDVIRAFEAGQRPLIRSPRAIRPWQHVLDALSGYLLLAERMMSGDSQAASGWNFGPSADDARPVAWIVDQLSQRWGSIGWDQPDAVQPHEAHLLTLDCAKAHALLGWRPVLTLGQALSLVVDWHRAVGKGLDARETTLAQIHDYAERMAARGSGEV